MKIQPLRGSRDLYPEDRAIQNWLFSVWRKVSQKFGYQEYEGPILEPFELFAVKSGEELVNEQTYTFKDRGGRKVAVRPEMTPTLARMVVQKQNQIPLPCRWFSIGNFWRYEKPQKGRERDFWQWNVDILGPTTPESDAEVIAVGCEFFKEVGLTPAEVSIKLNDRKLLETRLEIVGVPKNKILSVFRAIDKRPKIKKQEFQALLKRQGLDQSQVKDLQNSLEDFEYERESDRLTEIFSTLDDLGYSNYVSFDPQIVRNLDYYTSTVFEAFDKDGEFRAILAGGRYDNLVSDIGGKALPGVGFGAGDIVTQLVLEKYGKISTLSATPTKVLVTVFDEGLWRNSLQFFKKLIDAEIDAEIYPEAEKLDKQLKYADQKGIPYVAIIGPKEEKEGKITLKDMTTQTQTTLKVEEAMRKVQHTNLKLRTIG
jgi:histidyl-tRNA synthetase